MKWFSGLIASRLLKRKSKIDESNILRQPQAWGVTIFLLSFVCIAILLLAIIFPNIFGGKEESVGIIVFFGVIFLPVMFLYAYLMIWKVEVFESYFKFRSIFKNKKISYDNIEVRDVSSGFRFYDNNRHLLSISYLQDNYRLLSDAIKKYQKDNKIKIEKSVTNVLKPIQGLWFSAILLLFLTIFVTVAILIKDGTSTVFYKSLPFNLLSILIILYMINWKIEFNDDFLIKRSIWGWSKKYALKDVTFLQRQFFGNPNDTKIYYKNKKIAFIMGNTNNLYELQSVIKSRT